MAEHQLHTLIAMQKESLALLEAEAASMDASDLSVENKRLTKQLEESQTRIQEIAEKLELLKQQNRELREAVQSIAYSQREGLLSDKKKQADIFFAKVGAQGINGLQAWEQSMKREMDDIMRRLDGVTGDEGRELREQLKELSLRTAALLRQSRAQLAAEQGAFSARQQAQMDTLRREQLTDEQVARAASSGNLERFVGLNLLNKLGLLLIVIGVIVAAQYTYFKLPNTLKGALIFLLGGGMLALGELLNRKKANVFSLGVTAGGVAVLYVALSVNYFLLGNLNMYAALGLCVLVTAAAFLLSLRYNAQVILAFALVGGYLPIFSIAGGSALLYGGMVYFVILNLLALAVAFHKKWTITSCVGLALNILGTAYIVLLAAFSRGFGSDGRAHIAIVAYVFFAFLAYTLIPLVGSWRQRQALRLVDLIQLGVNTILSCLMMYGVFGICGWTGQYGLLAVLFACAYIGLGFFAEKKLSAEKNAQILFYLTGLAFVVLVVPLQFGVRWLTLGWLAEGMALALYGILWRQKRFAKVGLIICALCLGAFVYFDLALGVGGLFAWKYTAITLSSLLLLAVMLYADYQDYGLRNGVKYLGLVNLWLYSLYLIFVQLGNRLELPPHYNHAYMLCALAVGVTFALAAAVPRIPLLRDQVVKALSMVQYGLGVLAILVMNQISNPLYLYGQPLPAGLSTLLPNLVLWTLSIVSALALYDLLRALVLEKKLWIELLPLLLSAYVVVVFTQNLVNGYGLAFYSAVISILYVMTAFGWILFGFARRFALMRQFGLGLAVLSVAKLFLIDLYTMTEGYRIVSYFALGLVLLAISFVYQYFNKRLETKAEVIAGEGRD